MECGRGLYKSKWRGRVRRWPSRGEVEAAEDSRSADRAGRSSRSRCRGSNGGVGATGGAFIEAEEEVVCERKSVESDAIAGI